MIGPGAGVSLIAAVARNRVIGAGLKLPWHLPEDLKYFKRVTQGHPIVMGRKTYESIGRLLPGRENRIVTTQAGYRVEGAKVYSSVQEACEHAAGQEIFVIGGAQIYAETLKIADRLYLTLLDQDFEGDVLFPSWQQDQFTEVWREDHGIDASAGRAFGYSFVVLERKRT